MSRKSKKRSRDAMATTVSPFSIAIIVNILSRLPLKSILRFKCVCKSWFNLIKSPVFVTAHLHRSAKNPSLLIRYYNHQTGDDPGLMLLRNRTTLHDIEVPFLQGLSRFPKVVGSCSGVVCLDVSTSSVSALVLWNPGTRQFKRLPKPVFIEHPPFRTFWMVSAGFGFDEDDYDHVIMRIVNFQYRGNELGSELGSEYETRFEMYKSSAGSWKEIEANPGSCVVCDGQHAVAAKGALHWMANGIGQLGNRRFILSFDIKQEELWRTTMPEFPPENCVKTVPYNESLALAVYPGPRSIFNLFELFVMSDQKSWIKQFSIPINSVVYPVGSWRDCEIIMRRGNDFVLYNPRSRQGVILPLDGTVYSHQLFVIYVDSLVDVNGVHGNVNQEFDGKIAEVDGDVN